MKKQLLFQFCALFMSYSGFAQVNSAIVADVDGNVYKTVTISTQVWIAENLKTTKYNDGAAIPLVTDDKAWEVITTPGYCWYKNDATANKNTYGALYNWYTVNTNRLCPKGWHVPTDAEWSALTTYLGGKNVAGGKLKETGTTHWASPNTRATNESGFTALPSGSRATNGSFHFVGDSGTYWSSTEYDASSAWFRSMTCNYSSLTNFYGRKKVGWSVRCVKDK